MATLQEIIEINFPAMLRLFKELKPGEQIDPMLVAFKDNATSMMVIEGFYGPQSKGLSDRAMRKWLAEINADSYCFMCEAWIKILPINSEIPDSISDDPDRQEIVIVTAGNCDDDKIVVYDIRRDEGGQVIDLVERPEKPGVTLHARFCGLLREETKH